MQIEWEDIFIAKMSHVQIISILSKWSRLFGLIFLLIWYTFIERNKKTIEYLLLSRKANKSIVLFQNVYWFSCYNRWSANTMKLTLTAIARSQTHVSFWFAFNCLLERKRKIKFFYKNMRTSNTCMYTFYTSGQPLSQPLLTIFKDDRIHGAVHSCTT